MVFLPNWSLSLATAVLAVTTAITQATNGIIEHADIRLWAPLDRVLSLVWVTPNVHKIHHSREVSETNSNYANLLTVYDRVLGTYTPADRATSVVYGLDETDSAKAASFPGLLSMPFQTAEHQPVPDTKVRIHASAGQ